ncbi:hypothetical protein IHV12_19760 [Fictibacillus sp. 7GRE50]|uniref:hypothetical protein n=1 Tax=Fictibacillus sp. 7GRE50 TaxID=2745878 RepID=UPI0018CF9B2A|nr:hypothetical protein [Fictibacillus sp. 7GRE50]MBH0167165.1 hypothetical protein [Fictibacillus sp. 7GRE50]
MARKNRSLTTFGDVSNDIENNIKNEIVNDIEKDDNTTSKKLGDKDIPKDSNKDSKTEIKNDSEEKKEKDIKNDIIKENKNNIETNSKLDMILSGKDENKKIPQYVYLEPAIVRLLDKYGSVKKKGRSSKKSELINEILKEFFRKRGDL